MNLLGASPVKSHKNSSASGASFILAEGERGGTAHFWEEKMQGRCYQCVLIPDGDEKGARLSSVVPGARARCNGHKLKHTIPSECWKTLFY